MLSLVIHQNLEALYPRARVHDETAGLTWLGSLEQSLRPPFSTTGYSGVIILLSAKAP
jgi:hypothetical protein